MHMLDRCVLRKEIIKNKLRGGNIKTTPIEGKNQELFFWDSLDMYTEDHEWPLYDELKGYRFKELGEWGER